MRRIVFGLIFALSTSLASAGGLANIAEEAAFSYEVDPNLVLAVIEQETRQTPYAIGIAGEPFMFKNKQRALSLLYSLNTTPWLLVMRHQGERKRFLFKDKGAAQEYGASYPEWSTKIMRVKPIDVDVGAMQINLHYHAEQFASYEHMLDLRTNIFYGTKFLASLIKKHGLKRGVGRYNANDEVKLAAYSESVMRHYGRITN